MGIIDNSLRIASYATAGFLTGFWSHAAYTLADNDGMRLDSRNYLYHFNPVRIGIENTTNCFETFVPGNNFWRGDLKGALKQTCYDEITTLPEPFSYKDLPAHILSAKENKVFQAKHFDFWNPTSSLISGSICALTGGIYAVKTNPDIYPSLSQRATSYFSGAAHFFANTAKSAADAAKETATNMVDVLRTAANFVP